MSRAERIGYGENIDRLEAGELFDQWRAGIATLSDDEVYKACLAAGKSKEVANSWRIASIESKRPPPKSD